jgi:hypothetical protein
MATAVLILMAGFWSGPLYGQTKGTGGAGGIAPGTGETGGVKDIEDQTGPPGTHHSKASPQGWGKMKGKAPAGAGKQGWRSIQPPAAGTPTPGWEPKTSRPKAKSPAGPRAPELAVSPEEKPGTQRPKSPKGPKGPKEPTAAPTP